MEHIRVCSCLVIKKKIHTLTITQYLTIALQHLIVCTNKPREIINQSKEGVIDIPGGYGGVPSGSLMLHELKMPPIETEEEDVEGTSKLAPRGVKPRPSGSP